MKESKTIAKLQKEVFTYVGGLVTTVDYYVCTCIMVCCVFDPVTIDVLH